MNSLILKNLTITLPVTHINGLFSIRKSPTYISREKIKKYIRILILVSQNQKSFSLAEYLDLKTHPFIL